MNPASISPSAPATIAGAMHPAEEARMEIAGAVRENVAPELGDQRRRAAAARAGSAVSRRAFTSGGVSRHTGPLAMLAPMIDAVIERLMQRAARLFPVLRVEAAFLDHDPRPARSRSKARKAANTLRICGPL